MYSFANFYVETYGVWIRCKQPDRTPDFASKKAQSSSKYWDFGDYVVRKSNHWGIVGSCFWKLDGLPKKGILNLASQECGMIYYKDFGTSRQESPGKTLSTRQKFMLRQPDLHHEGPITEEFVQDLISKLGVCTQEVLEFVPDHSDMVLGEWVSCQANWVDQLLYAEQRCNTVLLKVKHQNKEKPEDDRKVIDITLCILRDFAEAKSLNFIQPL